MNTLNFDMGFGMVFFWLAFIAILFLIIKQFIHNDADHSEKVSTSPLETLKKRYAQGEIKKYEFESMKKELEK